MAAAAVELAAAVLVQAVVLVAEGAARDPPLEARHHLTVPVGVPELPLGQQLRSLGQQHQPRGQRLRVLAPARAQVHDRVSVPVAETSALEIVQGLNREHVPALELVARRQTHGHRRCRRLDQPVLAESVPEPGLGAVRGQARGQGSRIVLASGSSRDVYRDWVVRESEPIGRRRLKLGKEA